MVAASALSSPALVPRHFGLDWLRIAAFALLVPYHVGMYFAPGPWVVKGLHEIHWVAWPLAVLRPWRLPLLFLVSGYAARALLSRTGPLAFVRGRSMRLLLPLAFGVLLLVAPQTWVRVSAAGYRGGFWHFLTVDRPALGLAAFATEHLWFIAYLWFYCALLGLAVWLWPNLLQRLEGAIHRLARHPHLILLAPASALVGIQLAMLFVIPQGGNLLTDWHGHAAYLPPFLLGVALAGRPVIASALAAPWRLAIALSAFCAAALIGGEIAYPGSAWPPHVVQAGLTAAFAAMGWTMLAPLIAIAARLRHFDHPLRRPLAEAMFPAYLVHQTLIVVIGWELEFAGLGAGLEFDILIFGTVAGCAIAYFIGREIAWLRPLIGLPPRRPADGDRPVRIAPAAP